MEYTDPEPNGLARVIGGLIEANLDAYPERQRFLRPAVIGIRATDAEVGITIRLAPDVVMVANGAPERADVLVETDSETLTELPSVPLRAGMPDAFTTEGRAMLHKLRSGKLHVKGLVRHAGVVARLNRLLTVA